MALLLMMMMMMIWASWGCQADASGLQPWSRDPLCSWPVAPRIVQAARTVELPAASLGPHSFPARLRLAFEVEGEGLLLDLAQNRELMMGSSGLAYYLPNGTRTVHPASPEGNCCYRGSIEGYPDSWANVCVCSGLSGLLTVSRFRSYSLESTPDGQTRAYRLKPVTGVCTQSQRFHPHLVSKRAPLQRVKRESEAEHGYVELVIVADHAEFKLDPNLNRTRTRILEIASHMDGFFRFLGLRVALVGAEVWNNGNRVSTNGNAKEILRRFLAWREKDLLSQIPHDNVQLIVGPPFPAGVIGASTQGSICSKDSGGISMGHSVSSLIMASTLSHQLGHNLGLAHDSDGCGCNTSIRPQSRKCIMEAPTGIMPGLSFSTCSQRRFQEILQSDQVGCLLDQPEPTRLVNSRCGNRLVESGEQCDCGLFLECTDPCCNATTCQLIPGAQCATGQSCCHQCKLRSAGHTCRPVQNECDLPEFCDGTSPRCPSNVYKQDGSLCEGGKSVCHGGICPTYLSQCQARWGPDAVPTSEGCVASLNQRGDARGNCGQNPNGSYISCAKSDVRCGQLQCDKKRNGTVRSANCLRDALKIVVATDVLEEASALSGTNCGPNKVCINQRCQEVSSLELPVCQCNGRGLCNSKGHCHCEPGWAPPRCQAGGLGGSVDSGPPAPGEANRATSTALVAIVLFLAALLVVGLCCARRLGLHKRLCQFGKGTSCQYRTEPESQVQFLHPAERITQPEPRSYSKAPPNRPRPPQWKSNTELQLMPTSKGRRPRVPQHKAFFHTPFCFSFLRLAASDLRPTRPREKAEETGQHSRPLRWVPRGLSHLPSRCRLTRSRRIHRNDPALLFARCLLTLFPKSSPPAPPSLPLPRSHCLWIRPMPCPAVIPRSRCCHPDQLLHPHPRWPALQDALTKYNLARSHRELFSTLHKALLAGRTVRHLPRRSLGCRFCRMAPTPLHRLHPSEARGSDGGSSEMDVKVPEDIWRPTAGSPKRG